MKKNMKKIVSLLVVLSLFMAMTVTASATEIPEREEHKITYEFPAPGSDEATDDDGVQPLIWGQETHEPMAKTRYTTPFVIPDRYFAYEITATSGNPSGKYAVALVESSDTSVVCNISTTANGTVKKIDWLDVYPGTSYQFRISNMTGSTLKVTITYYSWK